MMLLLSTVYLSDLYLNMELLLLLISPTTSPMTWRKSRSVPSPLSILLLHAKMHLLRQGSQVSSKVVKMLVSMLKKELVLRTQPSLKFKVELFNHRWLTVNVQIDHLPPYHLILIVALILYKCLLLLYCTSQIFSSSC